MQQFPVSQLMRECPNAVVSETIPLREAAELLVTHGHSVLVAHDENDRLCGLIPETAVVRQLMANPNREADVTAVLSRHVESIRADADLCSILHLFRSSCHAVIPVVNSEESVVGMLHRQDVVRLLLSETNTAETEPSDGHQSPGTNIAQKPHFLTQKHLRDKAHESGKRRDNGADGDAVA